MQRGSDNGSCRHSSGSAGARRQRPHLSVGSPPIIRVNGVLERLDYPRLSANDTRELIYSILSQDQRQRLENEWEIDFSYSVPGRARFRVNAYFQRNVLGAAFRLIPSTSRSSKTWAAAGAARLTRKPRGFVLVTGPTGSRQVDDPGGDDRRDQRDARRAHHDDRGPDRVPAPATRSAWSTSARWARTPRASAAPSRACCARTPTSSSSARCATRRPWPTALTAAETGHLVFATLHTQDAPQTIDRMIDVFPPHQQEQIRVQLAPRSWASARSSCCRRGTAAAAWSPASCSSRRRRCATSSARARRTRSTPSCRPVPVRHADHGRRAGRPGAPRAHLARAGRAPLEHADESQAADGPAAGRRRGRALAEPAAGIRETADKTQQNVEGGS